MDELILLTAGQFVVSVLMALGALCAFCWAAATGLLSDAESDRRQPLDSEGIDDGRRR
jgi:hypothetical protein